MVERLGAQAWADAVGSVPLPAFTVTKLRLAGRARARARRRGATRCCCPTTG